MLFRSPFYILSFPLLLSSPFPFPLSFLSSPSPPLPSPSLSSPPLSLSLSLYVDQLFHTFLFTEVLKRSLPPLEPLVYRGIESSMHVSHMQRMSFFPKPSNIVLFQMAMGNLTSVVITSDKCAVGIVCKFNESKRKLLQLDRLIQYGEYPSVSPS